MGGVRLGEEGSIVGKLENKKLERGVDRLHEL